MGQDSKGQDVTESLDRLRDDVRGVIREVRDTLYDLRTDVSETQSPGRGRWRASSTACGSAAGLRIELFCDKRRPPAPAPGA